MKAPFVSRAHLMSAESYATACERNAQALSDALSRAERRYDDLLAKYHALKLAGAVTVEPPQAPAVATPLPADIVREAIRQQVRANPGITGLGGHLSDYARELRDERNLNPAQIVEALGKWESSEDESAAVDSYVETAPMTDDAIAEVIA